MTMEEKHDRGREDEEIGQPRPSDYPLPTQSEMWQRSLKAAIKEAIKEWLDEQFVTFGKWSLVAVISAVLSAMVWFIVTVKGGGKPPP